MVSKRKYRTKIKSSVLKVIDRIPQHDRQQIYNTVRCLAFDPRPIGCRKLKNAQGYRIRCGHYRIIYDICDDVLVVYVLKIGHRKDIYRH